MRVRERVRVGERKKIDENERDNERRAGEVREKADDMPLDPAEEEIAERVRPEKFRNRERSGSNLTVF